MSDQNRRNKSNFVFPFAIGVGIGVLAAFFGSKLFSSNNEEESHHRHSSTRRDLNTSSSVPIKPTEMCVICLERMEAPMEQLPCGHLFHQNCIIRSLKINDCCPICRVSLSASQMKVYLDRMNE